MDKKSKILQAARENISLPLNPLTASEEVMLKWSIIESQSIYEKLLPSGKIKKRERRKKGN